VLENGTIVMAFNAGFCHNKLETIGVAVSHGGWQGPWNLLAKNSILKNADGTPHRYVRNQGNESFELIRTDVVEVVVVTVVPGWLLRIPQFQTAVGANFVSVVGTHRDERTPLNISCFLGLQQQTLGSRCEDPFIWRTDRGWHLIVHNQQGAWMFLSRSPPLSRFLCGVVQYVIPCECVIFFLFAYLPSFSGLLPSFLGLLPSFLGLLPISCVATAPDPHVKQLVWMGPEHASKH
jgi:hypothetical protein